MRFFEGPPVLPPAAERVYSQNFNRSDTLYIYWELSLVHPPPGQEQTLAITAVYTLSSGTFFTLHGYISVILASATNTTHVKGSGFSEAGQWLAASYQVDLSVEGVLVARGTFQITE